MHIQSFAYILVISERIFDYLKSTGWALVVTSLLRCFVDEDFNFEATSTTAEILLIANSDSLKKLLS